MKAFQLSHDESEPVFTAQKGNSYTCCVLAGPSSKSMTNYLEEKRDKECTFEGLQGSLLLLKMITFNHNQQIFHTVDEDFNSFSWKKKKIPLINDQIPAWGWPPASFSLFNLSGMIRKPRSCQKKLKTAEFHFVYLAA